MPRAVNRKRMCDVEFSLEGPFDLKEKKMKGRLGEGCDDWRENFFFPTQ